MWVQGEALRAVLVPVPVFENDAREALADPWALRWWLTSQQDLSIPEVHPVAGRGIRRFGCLLVPDRRLWHHISGFQESMWHCVLERLEGERLYEAALLVRSWEEGSNARS